MEHRYDKRFPSDHKTLIFKNGMPVTIGRIQNFSRGGMFIETEIHLAEVNQSLDIELIGRSGSRLSANAGERRLCKTLVMHKANGGLGLMLREDCEETQRHFASFFAEEFAQHQAATQRLHMSNTELHISSTELPISTAGLNRPAQPAANSLLAENQSR